MIETILNFFLHFDTHLNTVIQFFGVWTYLVLFIIIFAETGLVVTPFLPGDSMLFAVGAFAAAGSLNITLVLIILTIAGVFGDGVNYTIGKYFSNILLNNKTFNRFIKREHLERTHNFYEKYGGKTIVIARFIPIIRTFAPFVAGIGKMSYIKFATYNISGAILWVCSIVLSGYYFGNIPAIKNNFSFVVLTIIVISVLPIVIKFISHHLKKKIIKDKNSTADEAFKKKQIMPDC